MSNRAVRANRSRRLAGTLWARLRSSASLARGHRSETPPNCSSRPGGSVGEVSGNSTSATQSAMPRSAARPRNTGAKRRARSTSESPHSSSSQYASTPSARSPSRYWRGTQKFPPPVGYLATKADPTKTGITAARRRPPDIPRRARVDGARRREENERTGSGRSPIGFRAAHHRHRARRSLSHRRGGVGLPAIRDRLRAPRPRRVLPRGYLELAVPSPGGDIHAAWRLLRATSRRLLPPVCAGALRSVALSAPARAQLRHEPARVRRGRADRRP